MSIEKENLKYCLHCSEPFKYKRRSAKYCCQSCRQMAWVGRKADVAVVVIINPVLPEKKIGFIKRIITWFRKK